MKISCQRSIILKRENQFLPHCTTTKYQSNTLSPSLLAPCSTTPMENYFLLLPLLLMLFCAIESTKIKTEIFPFDRRRKTFRFFLSFPQDICVLCCFVVGLHFNSWQKERKKKVNRKMKMWVVR